MENRSGQVTIFIIIAILILAIVIGYLVLSGTLSTRGLPPNIQPAYTNFVTCLEEDVSTGISVLESQGGYIDLPDFESGNNIQKEQIPSKEDMENELNSFIEGRIRDCSFEAYNEEGFEISLGEPNAKTSIRDKEVKVDLDMPVTIEKGNDTAVIKDHEVEINSKLGKLYDSAKEIYEEEQKELFLEEYGIDVLRSYAPVDGVEISCAPLTWDAEEVFDSLQEAIEINTAALKNKGQDDDYFALNLPVDENVRFLNSKDWPNSLEVLPGDERILVANPVGNQPGLGILGFCYVSYHFVYNLNYPVLIQVYEEIGEGEEVFQFPVAVVIQRNSPREALETPSAENVVPELCKYKNTEIQINTRDIQLAPVTADISYECFGNRCSIGTTELGVLNEAFPQCVNGYVSAKADGFKDARYLFSTIQSGSLDIILERTYETTIDLKLDGVTYDGSAVIHVLSDYATETLIYPEQKTVELGEGQHEFHVYIYTDSEIKIGKTTTQECIDVPRGILGVFGVTQEKCFDIEVPEQVISNALSGGGKQIKYLLETDLDEGRVLEINAQSFPTPETIEQVQDNYFLFETKDLVVGFA
jgi:hypothetical protein